MLALKMSKRGTAEVEALVGIRFVAEALGLSTEHTRRIVRAGDRRVPPPLDLPGTLRWRRTDVLAHLQSIPSAPVRGEDVAS